MPDNACDRDVAARTTQDRPSVAGIDISTHTIDLIRLAENDDTADWTSIHLTGNNAWQRVRTIRQHMPQPSWWQDIYLVAIERPFSRSRNDTIRLAQGAVLACIPTHIEVWEVVPHVWKKHLGIPANTKPSWQPFARSLWNADWPQDARDALGAALYARDTNAAGIEQALAAG